MRLDCEALCGLLLCTLLQGECSGQIVFSASDLQNHVGQYRQAYATTNVDISAWVGTSGGPQTWDFSLPPEAGEVVQRWDIVPPNDAQNTSGLSADYFAPYTNATWAERLSESDLTNTLTWSFFGPTNGQGVLDYGLFSQTSYGTNVLQQVFVYQPPVLLLPDQLHFGQGWSTVTDGTNSTVGLVTHIVTTNYADAYGAITLPQLGSLPALRLTEWYHETNLLGGVAYSSVSVTYYLWLVRGIGAAVNLSVYPNTPPNTTTNALVRVFDASPRSALNLHLQVRNGLLMLNWNAAADASGYEVESRPSLAGANWQPVAIITSNSWSAPFSIASPEQFFRVLLQP
jgi:hypothetical protein